jgi:hypothetical protein
MGNIAVIGNTSVFVIFKAIISSPHKSLVAGRLIITEQAGNFTPGGCIGIIAPGAGGTVFGSEIKVFVGIDGKEKAKILFLGIIVTYRCNIVGVGIRTGGIKEKPFVYGSFPLIVRL